MTKSLVKAINEEVTEILKERGAQHGEFKVQATISQTLRKCMKTTPNWSGDYSTLEDYKKEALEMIQHKVARILAGDSNLKDHWLDIAGYATLVADRLL